MNKNYTSPTTTVYEIYCEVISAGSPGKIPGHPHQKDDDNPDDYPGNHYGWEHGNHKGRG